MIRTSGITVPLVLVAVVLSGPNASAQGPPAPPTNLTAQVTHATGGVSLNWTASTGDRTSYIIQAGSAPGLSDITTIDVPGLFVGYHIHWGVPVGTYYVRVRAVNADGVSNPSNEVTVVVNPPCLPPLPPTLLTAVVSGASVTLSWKLTSNTSSTLLEAGTGQGLADLLPATWGRSRRSRSRRRQAPISSGSAPAAPAAASAFTRTK